MKKILSLIFLGTSLFLFSQNIRPIRDDIGFCWNLNGMEKLISYLEKNEQSATPPSPLIVGISPHDDYLYAGSVYFPLFRSIRAKEAVIFGVTHKSVRDRIGDPQQVIILDDYKAWPGIRGDIPVSELREHLKKNLKESDFLVSNTAHETEHSIEALLPFLQYYNPEISITPVMVTGMPFEKMEEISDRLAEVIGTYIRKKKLQPGRDIVFLISADAEHYGRDFQNAPFGEDEAAHSKAVTRDRQRVETYLTGSLQTLKLKGLTRELWGNTYIEYRDSYWCGKYSIPFGLLATMKIIERVQAKKLTGRLLRFSDTYSGGVLPVTQIGCGLTAVFSLKHWVSFFSIAYTAQ